MPPPVMPSRKPAFTAPSPVAAEGAGAMRGGADDEAGVVATGEGVAAAAAVLAAAAVSAVLVELVRDDEGLGDEKVVLVAAGAGGERGVEGPAVGRENTFDCWSCSRMELVIVVVCVD